MPRATLPTLLAFALLWGGAAAPAMAATAPGPWLEAAGRTTQGELLNEPNRPDDPAPVVGPALNKGPGASPNPGRRPPPQDGPSPNLVHEPNRPDDLAPVVGPPLVKTPVDPSLEKDLDLLTDGGSLAKPPSPGLRPGAISWALPLGWSALCGLGMGVPAAYLGAGEGAAAFRTGVTANVALGSLMAYTLFQTKIWSLEGAAEPDEAQAWAYLQRPESLPLWAGYLGVTAFGLADLVAKSQQPGFPTQLAAGAGLVGGVLGAGLTWAMLPSSMRPGAGPDLRRKR